MNCGLSVQQNSTDAQPPHQLIARLLHVDRDDAEAPVLFQRLVQGGRLARLLTSSPHHRIAPVLAERMRGIRLDIPFRGCERDVEALEQAAAACQLRNRLLRRQLIEVVSMLADRGIAACLIKGAVSLADQAPAGYLSAAVRGMEDIDIVVAPEDAETARALLDRRGWLCTSGTQAVAFSIDSPALVDLHAWSRRDPDRDDFFAKAHQTTAGGLKVTALNPQDAVQLRLAHNVIRQHLFVDFPLMDLYELASIITAHAEVINWPRLRSVGLMNEVSRILYAVLQRVRDEFGAPVPADMIPPAERHAVSRLRRELEKLRTVPHGLYYAAARHVLVCAAPGGTVDKLNRALDALVLDPLRSPSGARGRLVTPVKVAAQHAAFIGWKLFHT